MNAVIKNPHNFIPDRFDPQVIAIIGGKGSMGQRLAEEFHNDGYEVLLTGEQPLREIGPTQAKEWRRAIRRWNEKVCKDADVVIFSVPIPLLSNAGGLKRIFGHTPPRGWRDKLVIDICSTKAGPTRALSELKGAAVIGTHPMFGPKLKSLTGQTVFVCPVDPPHGNAVLRARLELRKEWLSAFWQRRGVQVVEINPEAHDLFMPAVQFGVLLSVLLYGDALRNSGVSMDKVQGYGTPNSKILCTRLARMISPAMLSTYINLAFDNPHNRAWVEHAMTSLSQLNGWLASGNREAAHEWIKELAGHQPAGFRGHFLDASTFIDECMAKRDFVSTCMANEKAIRGALSGSTSAPDAMTQVSAS
jgi:prephenate dehydrogenase